MEKFDQTYSHKLIYVFSMPYDTHKGLLKVGEATLTTDIKPEMLIPNCRELNQAAKARIDSYTKTASMQYKLEYTELAIKVADSHSFSFKDKDVHKVLMNSGIAKKQPNGATGEEWFQTNLATVMSAIKAVKDGKHSITPSEKTAGTSGTPIDFREEQIDAIDKTLKVFKKDNEMLWYAKMRFGKTLTALEVVRRLQYRRVIIVTHRPVVDDGWNKDFEKIFFPGNSEHEYYYEKKTKDSAYTFDEKTDSENDLKIKKLDKDGSYFFYFASIQDLRGSQLVGGNFNKNNAVFALDWDLIIIDEAHEGTQTELGDNVVKLLRKKHTKVLALSGTPFNLLSQYSDDNVYTWDYVMEQKKRDEWDLLHHGDHNPYADLPKMHIYTYDLGEKLKKYVSDEYDTKAFNFREFFRVWTEKEISKGICPSDAVEGSFAHENDVQSFLNLLVKNDTDSIYPFSTNEYRDMFRHTLWMVPGVKEAKALSEMLRKHPVFKNFGIANVAGEGDTYEEYHNQEALKLVRNTIKNNEYSITLSCGKLTTGVTVKEWTAVLMLSGSYSTAAAQYMQTIFRVQSAGSINGKQKTDCYVFDFAPDRTLKVLTETVHLSRKPGKSQAKRREAMTEFLNYCPVIAIAGSKMEKYSVNSMMEQIKQIYAERAVNSGFDDDSIYNDELLKLGEVEAEQFNDLKNTIGASKAQKKKDSVKVNGQGLTDEQIEHIDDDSRTNVEPPKPLTPEEIAERLKKKQAKEARKKAIDILRGISIRMPLLIYGARGADGADIALDEDIDIDRFVELVDKTSWEEFMPKGVTKEVFAKFTKYYDRDVFIAAGKRIRRLAAAADKETPTKRVQMIAEIFRHFKNPDKETVLTPWRVVNMHMSDTLGGWCFFNEKFEDDTQERKHRLEEPRFVNQGEITKEIFGENSQILEINSKTGLYPLYVAYSIYRQKLGDTAEKDYAIEDLRKLWADVLNNNVFVICKTPMAKSITRRTLAGYSGASVNAHSFDNLVNMLKNKPEQFKKRITKGSYWKKEVKEMKFDAVVGNPPYQEESTGVASQAIYPMFMNSARDLNPKLISMITPSRWMNATSGPLVDYRARMLKDNHIKLLVDFQNATFCFTTVEIKGGISYFLFDNEHSGDCTFISVDSNGNRVVSTRPLHIDGVDTIIRDDRIVSILNKVLSVDKSTFSSIVSNNDPFGFDIREDHCSKRIKPSYSLVKKDGDIPFYYNGWRKEGIGYVSKESIRKGHELISEYKVFIPKAWGVGDISKDWVNPYIPEDNAVCTETYLVVGPFPTRLHAENAITYMQTKFFHAMVSVAKGTQNTMQKAYMYVPCPDFSKSWTDSELFEKYNLSTEEIEFIVNTIRGKQDISIFHKMLNSSYSDIVKFLLKKYGAVKHNYFKDTECTVKNPAVSRTEDGLYCHHMDEDKAIMLSNDKYAAANPFDYQKANRLVYCNLLEHLLLHVKIAENPSEQANEGELPGIGGAINFICKQLNDIYAGKVPEEEWRKVVADKVKDDFDDYILVLKYLWNVVESNPLYKAIITKEMLCVGWDNKVVPTVLNALNGIGETENDE